MQIFSPIFLHLESNAQTKDTVSTVIEINLVACSSWSLNLTLIVGCVHVTEVNKESLSSIVAETSTEAV